MYLDADRRPTLTPKLALRIALLGGIALVAFGGIFFRLWYLQVLSGDKYLAEARNNQQREIKVEAPRGDRRAGLPAPVPLPHDRSPSLRHRRRGDEGGDEGPALPRRPARRPGRP